MDSITCVSHPGTAAVYRCDGCGKYLCDECAEQGHRLVFCRLCGERALPLDGSAPAAQVGRTLAERRRSAIARSATGYGLADAMAYAFRGTGGYVFLGYVVTLSIIDAVSIYVPFIGLLTLVPWILVILLVPKLLFSIANTTARGRNELPDWPDFDPWELVRTALLFVFVVLLCLIPAALLIQIPDCSPWALLAGEADVGPCLVALALGLLAAVALWIPAFGAVSLYDTFFAALRLDLHTRALLVAPQEVAVTVPILSALLFLRVLMPPLLGFIPILGIVLGHVVVGYALFTGAHLVGLYFRRHWGELEALYLG